MSPERFIKCIDAVFAGRFHFFQDPWVTTNRALTKNNQRAGKNVGTFNGNRNRNLLIGATQIIIRPHTNPFAAVNIHRVVNHVTHGFGSVVFRDRGKYRWFLAQIESSRGDGADSIDQIGGGTNSCQRLFNTLKFTNRHFELLAHARIGARGKARHFARRNRLRRQRNGAASGQAFHQHAPTLADHGLATDHPIHRDEHIFAMVRTVHERRVQCHVAATNIHTGVIGRNQRARNTQLCA